MKRVLLGSLALLLTVSIGLRAEPQTSAQPRIIAVGDIHGEAAGLARILQVAGLIDANRRWSGGTARLVQTGDFTDRGAEVRAVMDLLMRLEGEAKRTGGRVDVLFGNHEGFNVLRELRDVSPQAYAAFVDGRSEDRRRRAFEMHAAMAKSRKRGPDEAPSALNREQWMAAHPPGSVEYLEAMGPSGRYGRWMRARKAILQIGDTMFMHAGLRPDSTSSVEEVNRAVERDIRAWDGLVLALERARLVAPTFTFQQVMEAAQVEILRIVQAHKMETPLPDHVTPELITHLQMFPAMRTGTLVDPDGPLWYRGLATLPETAQPQIDALLTRHGARRIVVGHTTQLPGGRITTRFDGRVVLIDTGMLANHYKGGQPSALEIQDGRVTAIYPSGREPLAAGGPDTEAGRSRPAAGSVP